MFPLNFLRMFKRPPGKKPPPKNFVDLFWDADNARLVVQFDDGTTAPVSDEGGGGSVDWAVVTAATGTDPATGSGRFKFNLGVSGLATRNALGVGAVDLQTSWSDAAQVASGAFSFACGAGNTAAGNYAVAIGAGCTASGTIASAIGAECDASGIGSLAFGAGCTASGTASCAFGNGNEASATSALAVGVGSTASGSASAALGDTCQATATWSHASGFRAIASHTGSRVFSDSTNADFSSTVNDEFACRFSGGYRMTGGAFQVLVTTVAALPTASTHTYYEAWVSNANSPTVGAIVAGGGSAKAKVASNGTNWIVTAVI